jgi:hypothetical protein
LSLCFRVSTSQKKRGEKDERNSYLQLIKSPCNEALMRAIFSQFRAFSGDCEMNWGKSRAADLVAWVSTNVAATHPRVTGMGRRTHPQSLLCK